MKFMNRKSLLMGEAVSFLSKKFIFKKKKAFKQSPVEWSLKWQSFGGK